MKISRSFWKQLITILALGAGIALSGSTSASAQLTATMDVSARVVAICSVATVVDMSFGAIDGMSAADPTAQGSLSLNCGAGIDVWIGIDDGVGNDRTMDDGSGNLLAYDICKDIACATTWGNTAGTGLDYTGVGGPEAVQVYGQIANANVLLAPAGVYGDTVNVAVNYY
jgi:spore coat protein U-like protein